MTQPNATALSQVDPPDRLIRRAWVIFTAAFLILAALALVRLVAGGAQPLDWAVGALLILVGLTSLRHRQAVVALETGRRSEAESFARILSGLSRSVSPDAIVRAIVEELGTATDADHVVVARRRPDAMVLEATLTSTRLGVPDSTTILPIGDLIDPLDPGRELSAEPTLGALPVSADAAGLPEQAIADRIASRVRRTYGLSDTLAAPLTSEDGVIGAIVISRRIADAWPGPTRRILAGSALEASTALARVYSYRAAETRASTDALTGLPNRRYFDEFCGLLARRRRAEDAVGVLMIDIDLFKRLNDTYGHDTGDVVLRAVGAAIMAAVREDDVPARYGGEEFVVLLRNPSPGIAVEVGERVRAAVRDLDLRDVGVSKVSVSVGVAVAQVPDEPIADLIKAADRALYRAKRAGRDRVVAA